MEPITSQDSKAPQVEKPAATIPSEKEERRTMPIMPKEKLYDEWAAVIRHQDIVAQKNKTEEINSLKQQQQQYREQLTAQIEKKRIEAKTKDTGNLNIEKGSLEMQNLLFQVYYSSAY